MDWRLVKVMDADEALIGSNLAASPIVIMSADNIMLRAEANKSLFQFASTDMV
jgi:hypothetical protein